MIRQRTTVINSGPNHNDVIQNVNTTHLSLVPQPEHNFIVENKYTKTPEKFNYIKHLRIQTKFRGNTPQLSQLIFPYEFSEGINIYAIPQNINNPENKQAFYNQVQQVIYDLVGLKIDSSNWINNINSLYYHNVTPLNLNANHKFLQGVKLWKSDVDYELQLGDKLTLKQVVTDVPALQFQTERGVYKEIGLFLKDDSIAKGADDIVLSGLRVILDAKSTPDENVFKTMFHIKPRHRLLNRTIHSEIVDQGLHPILRTEVGELSSVTDEDVIPGECKLYYYINLNRSLIFDQFQSVPINSSLVINNGNKNLELPEYKINEWGNEVMFEFDTQPSQIDFTLHSRYQLPNASHTNASVIHSSLPQVFMACNVKDNHLLDKSPFDSRSVLGGNYEVYFTNNTVFYHINHDTSSSVNAKIPHGVTTFDRVNNITSITVLIGFTMIIYVILKKVITRKDDVVVSENKKNE